MMAPVQKGCHASGPQTGLDFNLTIHRAPCLAAKALDDKGVRYVKVRRKAVPTWRREVDIDLNISHKLPLHAATEAGEVSVEPVSIAHPYRRAARKALIGDFEAGFTGLSLHIDQPAQMLPIEDVDVRPENRFVSEQRFEPGQGKELSQF